MILLGEKGDFIRDFQYTKKYSSNIQNLEKYVGREEELFSILKNTYNNLIKKGNFVKKGKFIGQRE